MGRGLGSRVVRLHSVSAPDRVIVCVLHIQKRLLVFESGLKQQIVVGTEVVLGGGGLRLDVVDVV